jgi:hypothetical protein
MGQAAVVVKHLDLDKMSKDMGRADSFRYNVLSNVVEENYDGAIRELKSFLEGETLYPGLKGRTERYIMFCVDLVNAIRAKRNFPGIKSLTAAKQKELNDKYLSHFFELQQVLKRIERIEYDMKIEDSRSTVWVVKAIMIALAVILAFAFLKDLNKWLMGTIIYVTDDTLNRITDWIFSFF